MGDVMNQMAYKLEEADIEQKTFFQNASHELRTPLMSIQGYAEGLKYGVFESDEDLFIPVSFCVHRKPANKITTKKNRPNRSGP